jgi:hypothetical protein
MWLFLLAWVGICVLLILLYHIWLGLNKWPESGEQPEMMELAKQRITWTKPSPTRDDGIIRVVGNYTSVLVLDLSLAVGQKTRMLAGNECSWK